MVQTFHFLFSVWENKELKKEIFDALECDDKKRIIIRKYILTFEPQQRIVLIEYDGENPKFLDAKISFDALINLLNKNFDDLTEGSITYLY
ncbi:MAG: hypothetical protein IJD97_02465 [Clostridia bacterium]|nr:hypothetical protein [Clostridia bacterium]